MNCNHLLNIARPDERRTSPYYTREIYKEEAREYLAYKLKGRTTIYNLNLFV